MKKIALALGVLLSVGWIYDKATADDTGRWRHEFCQAVDNDYEAMANNARREYAELRGISQQQAASELMDAWIAGDC